MPENKIKMKQIDGVTFIHCLVRKKWIQLTPEEKVRQFLVHYLTEELNYPIKYISIEKKIVINQLSKRYDIVVYNYDLQPVILIECKANHIKLDQENLQQLLNYNILLRTPYLMLSNGTEHLIYQLNENSMNRIEQLPDKSVIFN